MPKLILEPLVVAPPPQVHHREVMPVLVERRFGELGVGVGLFLVVRVDRSVVPFERVLFPALAKRRRGQERAPGFAFMGGVEVRVLEPGAPVED